MAEKDKISLHTKEISKSQMDNMIKNKDKQDLLQMEISKMENNCRAYNFPEIG
jgi:hypothetical protein